MKTALITGGLRGIGLGISNSLLDEGFDLALCGSRAPEAVAQALEELQARAGADRAVRYYRCDVACRDDRDALLRDIRRDFGRLNFLVNNAGVAARVRDDLLTMTEENYRWLMEINLQGPFFLTQRAAAWMIEQRRADPTLGAGIVNISSISATVASPNRGEYCMSKAAMSMGTRLWALRLAEHGIPVYEIQPGLIKSDMTAGVTAKYDKLIDDGRVPQRRWGFPEDVGRAVAMLTRGDLAYSTGQIIMIDGGMTIPTL